MKRNNNIKMLAMLLTNRVFEAVTCVSTIAAFAPRHGNRFVEDALKQQRGTILGADASLPALMAKQFILAIASADRIMEALSKLTGGGGTKEIAQKMRREIGPYLEIRHSIEHSEERYIGKENGRDIALGQWQALDWFHNGVYRTLLRDGTVGTLAIDEPTMVKFHGFVQEAINTLDWDETLGVMEWGPGGSVASDERRRF
jgi:hypothetical protein